MTKSSTLLYLRDVLSVGYVPRLLVFSVVDLIEFRDAIIDRISNEFEGQFVAVRSSADDEDQIGSSSAGKYYSVLSIDACDRQQINKALDDVMLSYKTLVPQGNEASVIVQEMVTDVTMSGVIFSYHLSNSAPYYVINYDDMSGRTDTVTSGSTKHSNRSLYVYRSKSHHVRSARFVALLKAMEEVESKLESKSLDVEFAISGRSRIAILQARQIINTAEISNDNLALLDKTVQETELDLSRYFVKQQKQLGNFPILGQMPDWNPAEMIGRLPHNLSRSLYELLITNNSWERARGRMGYRSLVDSQLMISFAGHPYIDTQKSFYSFIPQELSEGLATKIVTAWLALLRASPEKHDKIEFDIATTCFSFDLDARLNETLGNALTDSELEEFQVAILKQAREIISLQNSFQWATSMISTLDKSATEFRFFGNLELSEDNVRFVISKIIDEGTVPFAILARHGFVAKSILDSLVSTGIFSPEEKEMFVNSVSTVAGDFLNDAQRLKSKAMSRNIFLTRYGHLRPGTYEISSQRYDQMANFEEMFMSNEGPNYRPPSNWNPSFKQISLIESRLKDFGFDFGAEALLNYISQSITQREYAKFVFTKHLSNLLESIAKHFENFGATREKISFIDIYDLLKVFQLSKAETGKEIDRLYLENSKIHAVNSLVRLPELIVEPSAAYIVPFVVNQPNFITSSTVAAPVIFLDEELDIHPSDLDGKLVALRGADPGYDWIFSHKIVGLITKYGGMNSHMAIRCAEFELPAAIGLGEKLYESLQESETIQLDCRAKRITVMS